jgi:hypothetical protein
MADGSSATVADAARRLLEALPPLVKFAETAGKVPTGSKQTEDDLYGEAGDEPIEMTPDQVAYCKNVLKVDPEKVRATMADQAAKRKGTVS